MEYHHIIPYREDNHFRPEDMVAVCPNCHGFLETQEIDRQRQIKENPANIRAGELRGMLQYDKRNLVFRVGGNWYEDTPTILQFRGISLIACRLENEQALVSVNLMNSAGRQVLKVQDNEVVFRVGDLWDFECKRNVAVARSGPRQIALKMDFSRAEAMIEGRLWAGDKLLELGPERTNIGSGVLAGNRVSGCAVGISIG